MLRLKQGDAVRIVDRVPTAADIRSGLYFGHYRNLSGTVFKLYGAGEAQQAAISVAVESLPQDVARRHHEIRDQLVATMIGAPKRLHSQGEEGGFALRYVVLVAVSDLQRRAPVTAQRRA